MIRGEIAKQTIELVSLSQRMEIADLTFNDIRVLLDLLRHCSVCPFKKVSARLEGSPRPAIGPKLKIATNDHEPHNSNPNYGRAKATYHIAHSRPLPFQILFFLLSYHLLSAWRALCSFLVLFLILRSYFKTQARPLADFWYLLPRCSGPSDGPFLFSSVMDYLSYLLLNTK